MIENQDQEEIIKNLEKELGSALDKNAELEKKLYEIQEEKNSSDDKLKSCENSLKKLKIILAVIVLAAAGAIFYQYMIISDTRKKIEAALSKISELQGELESRLQVSHEILAKIEIDSITGKFFKAGALKRVDFIDNLNFENADFFSASKYYSDVIATAGDFKIPEKFCRVYLNTDPAFIFFSTDVLKSIIFNSKPYYFSVRSYKRFVFSTHEELNIDNLLNLFQPDKLNPPLHDETINKSELMKKIASPKVRGAIRFFFETDVKDLYLAAIFHNGRLSYYTCSNMLVFDRASLLRELSERITVSNNNEIRVSLRDNDPRIDNASLEICLDILFEQIMKLSSF